MKTSTPKAFKREAFPSATELIVASALLLLSSATTTTTTPPNVRKISRSCVKPKNETNLEMAPNSLTRNLKAIATFVARFHELKKMKVARKKRTRTYWVSSGSDRFSYCNSADDRVVPSGSSSTSTVSCLTSSSGVEFTSNVGLDSAKSSPKRKLVNRGEVSNRIGSGHIRRRAEGILMVLANCGSASEVRIREILGDSPDTSKALRILLRGAEVKRRGAGGRGDPYTYSIA